MTIFSRHPVDNPVITQPWAANKTGGITPDPSGDAMQRLVYEYGNYQAHGHDGLDYGCPIGTPVYAAGSGVIDWSGWGQDMPAHIAAKYAFIHGPNGWPSGILVCIDHGSLGSYVAHLSESYYETGQYVPAGTLIGLSGNTGRSGGPHVHFSAIRFPVDYFDAMYSRVNPLDYFSVVTVTPIRLGNTGAPSTSKGLTMDQVQEIKDYLRALLIDGYTVHGKRYPGLSKVDIETQRRVTALTAVVAKNQQMTAAEMETVIKRALEAHSATEVK